MSTADTNSKTIPVARPSIGVDEENAVVAVLRSGWVSQGARVAEFEHNFAEYVGAAHAVAVSSCTTALHLAFVRGRHTWRRGSVSQPVFHSHGQRHCTPAQFRSSLILIDRPTILTPIASSVRSLLGRGPSWRFTR